MESTSVEVPPASAPQTCCELCGCVVSIIVKPGTMLYAFYRFEDSLYGGDPIRVCSLCGCVVGVGE